MVDDRGREYSDSYGTLFGIGILDVRIKMVKIIKEQECMIIRGEEESIVYQGKMMAAIPWLLPFKWIDGKELVYQKENAPNLSQWLQKERGEEEILDVLESFFQNQKELEAYLIDEDKLVLDPEWIFWIEKEKRLRLAYVPWDVSGKSKNSFAKRFSGLLWCAALNQNWQNERLILMLYRMQVAVKHQNQPRSWCQWIEQEKRKVKDRDLVKEQALDILTETELYDEKKGWFHRLREKIPFAIR